MDINKPRDRVPGISAIYFITPNESNIKQIAKDAERELYSSFYINFIDNIERELLESFAKMTAEKEFSNRIEKIYDQYANYISLEEQLFYFNIPRFYARLLKSGDQEVQQIAQDVVDGLFCVCVSLNIKPILCFNKKSHVLKQIAQDLQKKIQKYARSLFTQIGSKKPLMLLLERDLDLATALHHGSTYQALIHDLIGIQNNKILVQIKNQKRPSQYHLDTSDQFWIENKDLPFPEVDENYKKATQSWEAKKDKMTTKSKNLQEESNRLKNAVSQIGAVSQEKDIIDKHANILIETLLPELKNREIGKFFVCEEGLIRGEAEFKEILEVCSKGNDEGEKDKNTGMTKNQSDRLRLLLIHFLCCGNENGENEKLQKLLKKEDINLSALQHIKTLKAFSKTKQPVQVEKSDTTRDAVNWLKNITTKTVVNLQSALLHKNAANCKAAKLLDRLCCTNKDEQYMYVDSSGS
eukprot:UN33215